MARALTAISNNNPGPYISDLFAALSGCTADGFKLLMRPNSLICFMEQFHTWHQAQYDFLPTNLTSTMFHDRLKLFRAIAPKLDGDGKVVLDGWQEQIGFINGKLKFIVIQYEGTLKEFQPLKIKQGVKDAIAELEEKVRSIAPPGMQSLMHTGDMSWTWSATEKGLVEGE
jgi:hypothetical protein